MRGRKAVQNPKTRVIRITERARTGLLELRKKLGMPAYYTENEIIEGILKVIP